MRPALHPACSNAGPRGPGRMPMDSMPDAAEASDLISAIYDAALDAALWPGVVERITRFVGGFSARLSIRERAAGIAHATSHGDASDPHCGQLHADEWMAPQGIGDNPICVLDRSAVGGPAYGVFLPRTDGESHGRAFERMRLIAPHLRRAAQIARVLEMRKAETERLAEVLDGLAAGVILVDGERRVVHANASGQAMLAQRTALHAVNGRVCVRAADAQRALHKSVAVAAETKGGAAGSLSAARTGGADRSGQGTTLVLDRGEGGAPCLAHVLPLARGAEPHARRSHGAVAALLVHDAVPAAPSTGALIARHYRLTPGEVRVLMAIVEVGGVRETAEALGIAETTVKTHLQRIFSKTGSARQADLVRLVAGFSSPLLR